MTTIAVDGVHARVRAGSRGATALAPQRAPSPTRRLLPRPHLRLVEVPTRRARRRRRTITVATTTIVVTLLTVVVFHVVLAQSQLAIDGLGQRTDAVERRYEEARLEHARLSAPQRIVERAAQLGLVPPDRPPTAVPVTGAVPPEPDAPSTTLHGWTEVKPTLGDGP
jgi:cell division protein FtsL